MTRGLDATAELWPDIRRAYTWVHRAAHVLTNAADACGADVHRELAGVVAAMTDWQPHAGALAPAIAHFRRVTRSYAPGLCHCYDVAGLPRTNNDLEQLFGSTRYRERRASGRRGASPALVLRGSVRVIAVATTPPAGFTADALAPRDVRAWRALRAQLDVRHTQRRVQSRFRRDPDAYLRALEQQMLQPALPS